MYIRIYLCIYVLRGRILYNACIYVCIDIYYWVLWVCACSPFENDMPQVDDNPSIWNLSTSLSLYGVDSWQRTSGDYFTMKHVFEILRGEYLYKYIYVYIM